VAALDLASVDWVALSACDTGTGGIATGEGVLGLRRAFAIAGARTLVMTLWPVDDRDARRWMKAAYTAHFSRGKSAAEAARLAARELLRERRARGLDTSPFHWGGFVAAGR
jgi:CHAT domain-containing protein